MKYFIIQKNHVLRSKRFSSHTERSRSVCYKFINVKLIILFFFSLYENSLIAQDIHFSNLPVANVSINPANTGYFEGDWRISNIYRTQGNNFSAPFYSELLGFDKKFFIHNQQINAGICYINDMSAQNTLIVNQIFFTTSYHLQISESSAVSFGLHTGFVNKNSDNRGLTLPEQYDISIGGFNSSLTSSETLYGVNTGYLDLGSGFSWRIKKSKYFVETGIAIYHVNKPSEKFLSEDQTVPMKYIFQAIIGVLISNNITIKPKAIYNYVNLNSELNTGTEIIYKFNYITSLMAGISARTGFGRNADAAIISAGIGYKNWTAGISYDYDISGLHTITSRSNAIEFSIVYIRPETKLKNLKSPCILY